MTSSRSLWEAGMGLDAAGNGNLGLPRCYRGLRALRGENGATGEQGVGASLQGVPDAVTSSSWVMLITFKCIFCLVLWVFTFKSKLLTCTQSLWWCIDFVFFG